MKNYISEIRSFYNLLDVKPISTGQIALWYALMHINNLSNWSEWFTVANSKLEFYSGLSRSGIQKARNSLKQYGIIDFKPNGKKATSYKLISLCIANSNQDSNQVGNQDSNQSSNQNSGTYNKQKQKQKPKQKENNKEIYEQIIEYLNDKTGRHYKSTINKTVALIDSRLAEGFNYSDFFKVIDNKTSDWLNNPQMNKFLRPETLFGNKFESYLNEGDSIAENNRVFENGICEAKGIVY